MAKEDTLDLIHKAMFSLEPVKLSEENKQLLERMKATYTTWLENPMMSTTQLRNYMMTSFGLSRQAALRELNYVRTIMGDVTNASKEFWRYKVNHLADMAAQAAVAGDDRKAKALCKVAEIYIKNNRTDQEDGEKIPYDQIVPPQFEMSVDPEVAGVHADPTVMAKARRLQEKYLREISDAEYEEVKDGEE